MTKSVVLLVLVVTCVIVPTNVLGYVSSASAGDCVCGTTTVNARSQGSLSGTVLYQLRNGQCGTALGGSVYRDGYRWIQLTYNGRTAWVARQLSQQRIIIFMSRWSSSSSSSSSSCPSIVSRSAWGARAATSSSTMRHPASYVFIHHSDTPTCSSRSSCASRVRSIQNYHMNTNKWSDIGYSFLVGGDGSIFEGRGWNKVGAHTKNYNSRGFGICLIGDFMSASPTSAQIASARRLIACGVSQGKISSGYTLRGHRDVGSTDCPGNVLYNMIRGWPNY